MPALRLSIPITKVDAAQRLVFGIATAEIADRAGEICDYESTKPHYEKWSQDIAKSTGGRSHGNLRAMHGAVAAGKVTALTFNDAKKQIEICAKVVDDSEWTKVQEGVYTGFSQGGSYARRWTDADGNLRYTAQPSEVSLVDLPCLPEAKFEMIKADGTREWRPFVKGLEDVARLAALVQELDWLRDSAVMEAATEDDASNMGDRLQDLVTRAAAILRAMVAEETNELTSGTNAASAPSTLAPMKAHAKDGLGKLGARNSEADLQRIQAMHDASVELGATCAAHKAAMPAFDKRFDALSTTLADVLTRVKNIEEQPLPLPLAGRTHAVSKHDDRAAPTETESSVEKLIGDPDALSLLAIKLAQRNGRTFR